ncbi:MAG TPA: MarR family transcriptional regulator [Methanocella sp.]|uniref:MarR family transcriptional regulator n=1 Tax=Methanocella sp. TaxID=2052833 RepID=UPI002C1CAE05|nr:MarR family transcriptional regulator [Methanocella sp.]HTY91104.1 MarR family transcriptional regulator [Methanocella sp.]
MAKEEFLKLMEIWVRILNKMDEADTRKRDYGTGGVLSPAEIHLVQAIGMNPGMNVTDMAKNMGVTKGAVSQMVKKLESKGLAVKYSSAGNEKEVLLKLTASGKVAQNGHDRYHAMLVNSVENSLGNLAEDEFLLLEKFLLAMEKCADEFDCAR